MTTGKYELSWIGAILIITIVLFGGLTGLNFSDFTVVLHDNYFIIPFPAPLALTFFWLTLIIIGFREIKYRFKRKSSIIILLVDNTLTLLMTGYFLYEFFWLSFYSGFYQTVVNSKQASDFNSPLFGLIKYIQWIGFAVLSLLTLFEIFLLFQLRRIRKEKMKDS